MNTSNKLLVALLGIQVAALVGMNLSLGQNRLALATSVRLFPDLSAADVSSVEIFGASNNDTKERVVLKRSGDDWVIPEADDYPAKGEEIERLLSTLVDLRSRNQVLTGSAYHTKLEVAEGDYRRKVIMTTNDGEKTLYLGSSPSFKNIHVRPAGGDVVYQVADLSESDAGSRAWNWVDRTFVSTPKEEVWSVKLTNLNGELQLDRDPATDTWALLGESRPLDSTAIDSLVNDARDIGLETPISKSRKPEYKLGDVATVTLTVGSSTIANSAPTSTKTITVSVGAKIDGDRYYLASSTSDYVVEVAGWELRTLIESTPETLIKNDQPVGGAASMPASRPSGAAPAPTQNAVPKAVEGSESSVIDEAKAPAVDAKAKAQSAAADIKASAASEPAQVKAAAHSPAEAVTTKAEADAKAMMDPAKAQAEAQAAKAQADAEAAKAKAEAEVKAAAEAAKAQAEAQAAKAKAEAEAAKAKAEAEVKAAAEAAKAQAEAQAAKAKAEAEAAKAKAEAEVKAAAEAAKAQAEAQAAKAKAEAEAAKAKAEAEAKAAAEAAKAQAAKAKAEAEAAKAKAEANVKAEADAAAEPRP